MVIHCDQTWSVAGGLLWTEMVGSSDSGRWVLMECNKSGFLDRQWLVWPLDSGRRDLKGQWKMMLHGHWSLSPHGQW